MKHALLALAVTALAFGLRWRASERLPADLDEQPYLTSARALADVLRAGDLAKLTETNLQPEHPQLNQLLLAVAILPAPPSEPSPERLAASGGRSQLPEAELIAARRASAAFGALEVLLLACVSPLAGLFLALHTYTIKYTSLVMLEALPAAMSLAAVLCYQRFRRTERSAWWIASGALLGLTAAGKYLFAVAGIAIALDWALALRAARGSPRPLLLWGALALATFFAANPYLWPDPLWRLQFTLLYHAEYSTNAAATGRYPFWQPIVWLATSLPRAAAPGGPVLYPLRLDPAVSLLALAGVAFLWRTQRVQALWLGVGVAFLLFWGTKWPHYVLILSAPLCLAAAEAVGRLAVTPLRKRLAGAR
jgi:hypothetical protein